MNCTLLLNIEFTVVDSLKPTEIVVSFSSLSYWNESPAATKDEAKTPMKLNVRDNKSDSRLGDVPSESNLPSDSHTPVTGKALLLLVAFCELH